MNHFNLQKNAVASFGDCRGLVSVYDDPKGLVVCPKPRRVGVLANNLIRPLRLHMSHQAEMHNSNAEADLLDSILMKEEPGVEQSATLVASSPPFFCGSPPTRTANPLTQDARFGDEKLPSVSPLSIAPPSDLSSPTRSSRNGGCMRMTYGLKPAAVRVEGFDCLNRDRQNSRILAMA